MSQKREGAVSLAACVCAEFIKMRRAPIWIAFLVLPAVSTVIGCANYLANIDVLTPGWESLWTQQTLFVCYFFLPALLGAGASYLWRLEHQGSNWNELMAAPIPAWCVFTAKLAAGAFLSAVAFAAMTALFVVSGLVLGVPGSFPVAEFVEEVALGWVGSLAIVAIQLVVSLLVRNFAAPVGIALGGGILGLLAATVGLGSVFPYALMQTGMNSNALVVLDAVTIARILVMSVAWVVAAGTFVSVWLRRVDIHA